MDYELANIFYKLSKSHVNLITRTQKLCSSAHESHFPSIGKVSSLQELPFWNLCWFVLLTRFTAHMNITYIHVQYAKLIISKEIDFVERFLQGVIPRCST